MKILAIILFALTVFISCKSEDKKANKGNEDVVSGIDLSDSTKFTTVKWLDSMVDFGSVTNGQRVNVQFRYVNTGTKPLVIGGVVAGCGCTIPEYTQEPVLPGKEGYVKAVFNSINQPPTVHKTISVAMNTKEQSYTLTFIGEVKNEN
jgi:hypothetical protein